MVSPNYNIEHNLLINNNHSKIRHVLIYPILFEICFIIENQSLFNFNSFPTINKKDKIPINPKMHLA